MMKATEADNVLHQTTAQFVAYTLLLLCLAYQTSNVMPHNNMQAGADKKWNFTEIEVDFTQIFDQSA